MQRILFVDLLRGQCPVVVIVLSQSDAPHFELNV